MWCTICILEDPPVCGSACHKNHYLTKKNRKKIIYQTHSKKWFQSKWKKKLTKVLVFFFGFFFCVCASFSEYICFFFQIVQTIIYMVPSSKTTTKKKSAKKKKFIYFLSIIHYIKKLFYNSPVFWFFFWWAKRTKKAFCVGDWRDKVSKVAHTQKTFFFVFEKSFFSGPKPSYFFCFPQPKLPTFGKLLISMSFFPKPKKNFFDSHNFGTMYF